MKTFFEQDEYTLKDIQTLIDIQAEETLYLEFKGAGAIQKKEESILKLAIQISSFANSDGGVMIYGLKEKDNKAHAIEFIDTKTFPKEWLQNVIDSKIQRKLSTVEIKQIENPDNNFEAIYVIKIKQSPHVPHMANDRRFYRRTSTGKIPMEEYEVRDGYYRTGKTSLSLTIYCESHQNKHQGHRKPTEIIWTMPFTIHNVGEVIETMYKLEVEYPSTVCRISDKFIKRNNFIHRFKGQNGIITINNVTPLFPHENDIIFYLELFALRSLVHKFNSEKIKYTLYYSNGTEKSAFKICELALYNGNKLEMSDLED